jgi:hypothetical protein
MLEVQFDVISYIEAKAGWADVGAGRAGQAAFPKLIPERALHAQSQDRREIADVKVQSVREARPLLTEHSVQALHLLLSGRAGIGIAVECSCPASVPTSTA